MWGTSRSRLAHVLLARARVRVQEENMVSSAEMRTKYASVEEAEDDFM